MVNTVLLRKIQRKAKNINANSILWLEGQNLIFVFYFSVKWE